MTDTVKKTCENCETRRKELGVYIGKCTNRCFWTSNEEVKDYWEIIDG